jgi:hypothetical protein
MPIRILAVEEFAKREAGRISPIPAPAMDMFLTKSLLFIFNRCFF